jgi:hypothetical protein
MFGERRPDAQIAARASNRLAGCDFRGQTPLHHHHLNMSKRIQIVVLSAVLMGSRKLISYSSRQAEVDILASAKGAVSSNYIL